MKKIPIEFSRLEDEDRQYVERIIKIFPVWHQFASMFLEDGIWRPEIRIESPAGRERDLVFWSSDSDGPSWSFGQWHSHLDLFPAETTEGNVKLLAKNVQLILIDKMLLLFEDELDDFPNIIELEELNSISRDSFHKALSWSGKHDVV